MYFSYLVILVRFMLLNLNQLIVYFSYNYMYLALVESPRVTGLLQTSKSTKMRLEIWIIE